MTDLMRWIEHYLSLTPMTVERFVDEYTTPTWPARRDYRAFRIRTHLAKMETQHYVHIARCPEGVCYRWEDDPFHG